MYIYKYKKCYKNKKTCTLPPCTWCIKVALILLRMSKKSNAEVLAIIIETTILERLNFLHKTLYWCLD